jgi:ribosomal protein S27E
VSDDDGVISILDRLNKAEQQDTPVTTVKQSDCEHKQCVVDDKLPRVTCSKCGEVLDPYYVIRLIQKYFEKRDYRWAAIEAHEKKEAQAEAAQLHRVKPYQMRQYGVPEGSYITHRAEYCVQHTPKGWETTWKGTVVRVSGTLSAAKSFIRDHVRTNWRKEAARSLAQLEASKRTTLPEAAAQSEPEHSTTISNQEGGQ